MSFIAASTLNGAGVDDGFAGVGNGSAGFEVSTGAALSGGVGAGCGGVLVVVAFGVGALDVVAIVGALGRVM